jgi:hypothetical protein
MTAEGYYSMNELASGLPQVRQSPANVGTLVAIVVRPDKELRELPQSCVVTSEDGIPGDRWKKYCTSTLPDGRLDPQTQLTLMNARAVALVAGKEERWALAGDNLLVDLDLSEENLPPGQRLKVGEAILEITAKPHTGCAKFLRRFGADALKFVNAPEYKNLRLRGVHAQVAQPGRITIGDRIEKL